MTLANLGWRALLLGLGGSVLFLTSIACAQPEARPLARPQPGLDVQDYDFELTVADTTDRIEGVATIRLQVTTDTLSAVRLDLVGPPTDPEAAGMQVREVLAGQASVPYTHARDRLTIDPESSLEVGQRYTFQIQYDGHPSDGLIIDTNRHGERTFFGDNWPNRARHWLPVVDHLSDKATVDFRVRAPASYDIVSNGVLIHDSTAGSTRVAHWRTEVPLPTKVMVVGIADFVVDTVATVNGVSVQSWVYPEDKTAGFKDLGQAPPILRFFASKLGPYPYEKLANVQSTTRYGGMENASAIFYSENAVADEENDLPLVTHEVAHQWFGNTVTEADWPHLWLSEGFATYLTALYLEHARGEAALMQSMQSSRRQVLQFEQAHPSEPLVDTTYQNPTELLNTMPYHKGAWVLHMLRRRVGTDVFWEGLRTYYDRYRYQNARTRDFRAVMEDVSGVDLERFFIQWTRRAGHPALEVEWSYDEAEAACNVVLSQVQDGPAFRIPVQLGFEGLPPEPVTVVMDDETVRAGVDCTERPSSVVVDPNTNLLAEWSTKHVK